MSTHQSTAVRAQAPGETQQDWRLRGACRDEDPDLHFPVGNSGPALLQIIQAKTVCRRCPVLAICLAWALDHDEEHGVWGATTEDERRAIKQRGRQTRHERKETAA